MGYISQETKKELSPAIKAALKKYGLKGSIAIKHYSTLVVNISSGPIDFGTDERGYKQVNPYWVADHYEGDARDFLIELIAAMKGEGWYNNSDPYQDYHDVAYYLSVNVGKWNKPYVFTGAPVAA